MSNLNSTPTEIQIVNDAVLTMTVEAIRIGLLTEKFTKLPSELAPADAAVAFACITKMNETCGALRHCGADKLIRFFKHYEGEVSNALHWGDKAISYLNELQKNSGLLDKLDSELKSRLDAEKARSGKGSDDEEDNDERDAA